jgi:guanyl-specific ribonuclease Sa
MTVMDIADTTATIQDPSASMLAKISSPLLLVASVGLPGGGYGKIDDIQLNTRFITTSNGVTTDLQLTLDRIASGRSFPHYNDGSIFRNNQSLLPIESHGYYKEFVHPTPGLNHAGLMRIVTGQNGEAYFTFDHYQTFIRIK